MKIWTISDTHTKHWQLEIPEDVDMVIHAGDSTNSKVDYKNATEFTDFIDWFDELDIKHKVIIGGNHDYWATDNKLRKFMLEGTNIHYLENSYVEIEGIKIFGTPYTPNFGDWYFMRSRERLGRMFADVDEPMDILVSHGPPKGILDIAPISRAAFEHAGDNALLKLVERLSPIYHIFGHIHNLSDGCTINEGIFKSSKYDTTFINTSCCSDGVIGYPTSNGHVINYKN